MSSSKKESAEAAAEPREYVHGHSAAVLSAHARRTAMAFTSYILPHIQPHFRILDVGCGPGTISADLAALVPHGSVTCLDPSETALAAARAVATERRLANVRFVQASAEALPFPDGDGDGDGGAGGEGGGGEGFDLVHAHQTVIHTRDTVAAMREMRRVLRPGGLLASKDMIISSMAWHPSSAAGGDFSGLEVWRRAMQASMAVAGSDPEAGASTKAAALRAGFGPGSVRCSVGSWCFAEPGDVGWWGGSVADRLADRDATLRRLAVESGVLTEEELDEGVAAWRRWAEHPDAWFGVMNGEIICTK